MFREFAAIPLTPEGVVAFANRRGPLTLDRRFRIASPEPPHDELGVWAEPLVEWLFEVAHLRQVVRIWDLCQGGQVSELQKFIRWREDEDGHPRVEHVMPADARYNPGLWGNRRVGVVGVIASRTVNERLLTVMPEGDVILPARIYIQKTLDLCLSSLTATGMELDLSTAAMSVQVTPRNLLGAMWLQFARAVEGGKDFRQCSNCGNWIEVPPTAAHAARLFCSNSCKTKNYRDRKERVRRLAREGKTIDAIASEVGADRESVAKWVGDDPEG